MEDEGGSRGEKERRDGGRDSWHMSEPLIPCRVLSPVLPLTVILWETTGSRAGLEPAGPLSLGIRGCGTVPKPINPAAILG